MAQPQYAIQYLGTVRVKANTEYTNTAILALPGFSTATVVQLCTDIPGDTVGITINSTPMCNYHDGSEQYLASTPAQTYTFNKYCTLRIGIYKAVV